MCKNHPTCNATLVTNPCLVNGLHMKFRRTGRQLQVDHHWSGTTCMTQLHGEKTWNWWKIIILWLSREKGHLTSAICCRSGCNWKWRSCFNMSLFKPKNLFYIHILLERLDRQRPVAQWHADTSAFSTRTGSKSHAAQALFSILGLYYKGNLRKTIPFCSLGVFPPVLAGPNATWITEPRTKAPAELSSFHFAALRYLWKGRWC